MEKRYKLPLDTVIRITGDSFGDSFIILLEDYLLANMCTCTSENVFHWTIKVICGVPKIDYTKFNEFSPTPDFDAKIKQMNNIEFVILFEKAASLCFWNTKQKIVKYYCNTDINNKSMVQDIYSIVRWIMVYCVKDKEWAILHGVALEFKGKGILILGEKGSGKTTLGSALLEKGAKYISSDRAIVWQDDNRLYHVMGWIGTYRLTKRSINLVLNFSKKMKIKDLLNTVDVFQDKYRFPPYALIKALGWEKKGKAIIDGVIVLNRDNKTNDNLYEISQNEFVAAVRCSIVNTNFPWGDGELVLNKEFFSFALQADTLSTACIISKLEEILDYDIK